MMFRQWHVTIMRENERDYEQIYIGNEGVKHNIKIEEQKNEIIKGKVLLEWSRFECLRMVSFP